MERFNKAAIISGLSTVFVGCGSSGSESINVEGQAWRLKHSEVHPYSVDSIAKAPYAGDTSVSYDANGEISSYDDHYIPPTYTAVRVENGVVVSEERITKAQIADYQDQLNISIVSSHSEQSCFKTGDVYATSQISHSAADSWGVTTTLTRYLSDLLSSDFWGNGDLTFSCEEIGSANVPCQFTSGQIQESEASAQECSESVTRTSGVDFIDWGDSTYSWSAISDEWAGTDNLRFIEDLTFEDLADLESDVSDFLFPIIVGGSDARADGTILSTEIDDPLIPSVETIREYDSEGKLISVVYPSPLSLVVAETVDLSKYITLTWQGQSLEKITTTTAGLVQITNPSTGVSQDIYLGPNSEYRYDYSEFNHGILKATIYTERDGTMQTLITLRATYEQADCGPMTMERSKKYVPQPFPVCFER